MAGGTIGMERTAPGAVSRDDPSGRGPVIPRSWFVVVLSLSALVVAVMMQRAHLRIVADNRGFAIASAAIMLLVAARFAARREETVGQARLKEICEHVLAFVAIALLGVIASYSAAVDTSGFADGALARADRLLHFDWLSWYRLVSDHPFLQQIGAAAYATIYISPLLLLVWFGLAGDRASARRFLLSFWFGALITLLCYPLMPAEGPLAFLWRGPIPYMPTSALYQEQLIPALRSHTVREIDLGALRGLVCAPSFHTVSGLLYIAAAWPVARLRWPLLALNGAMLLATPVEGTHYLIDMVAGALVALLSLWLVRRVVGLIERGSPPVPVRWRMAIMPAAVRDGLAK